jgi:threonine dehydrogenase-like Zn-dependent dehydrogenase
MIDPLACAIHAVNQAKIKNGSTVVVIGQGSSGLCTLQALKALTDARVAVVDRHDDKLELSRQFGADLVLHSDRDDIPAALRAWSGGDGADYAIEVTGSASGAQLALCSVHFHGRVVIYGVFDGSVPIDLNELRKNELEVVGATGSPGTYPLAAELDSSGRVNLRPIVSRIIRLHDIPALFSDGAHATNTRKAVIDFTNG